MTRRRHKEIHKWQLLRQAAAEIERKQSRGCASRYAAKPNHLYRLGRRSLPHTKPYLDIALEWLLCIHSPRDCSLPRDLVQRRSQFAIMSPPLPLAVARRLEGARVHSSRLREWRQHYLSYRQWSTTPRCHP